MSLFHSLNVGAESLFTTRQGVDTASHNIANAQTEGYSRQRVNLKTRDPSLRHNVIIGNGAYASHVSRSHDQFVEKQLVDANTQKSSSDITKKNYASLELIFDPELSNSVSDEMNSFFDSLNSLSTFPEDLGTRVNVFESGKSLAASFNRVDSQLRSNRDDLNDHIYNLTSGVNGTLKTIANLNVRIQEMENGPKGEANDLRDERDLLTRNLAKDIDVHYYEDRYGMMTVRGAGDHLLVEGGRSAGLDVAKDFENDGMYDIVLLNFEGNGPRKITESFGHGAVKSLLDGRDGVTKDLIDKNNEMAMTFANRFNAIHQEGYGLNDYAFAKGRGFFDAINDVGTAAQTMKVSASIENSVDAIGVASTPNAPGDNVIVNRLTALKGEKVLADGSATFTDYYGNFVGELGIQSLRAIHVSEANDIVSANLETLRESVSGVSLDEEATNMIKWQTAFTASSKVITTVDEMLETVLSLKR